MTGAGYISQKFNLLAHQGWLDKGLDNIKFSFVYEQRLSQRDLSRVVIG